MVRRVVHARARELWFHRTIRNQWGTSDAVDDLMAQIEQEGERHENHARIRLGPCTVVQSRDRSAQQPARHRKSERHPPASRHHIASKWHPAASWWLGHPRWKL